MSGFRVYVVLFVNIVYRNFDHDQFLSDFIDFSPFFALFSPLPSFFELFLPFPSDCPCPFDVFIGARTYKIMKFNLAI